jgi:hypothetical protein
MGGFFLGYKPVITNKIYNPREGLEGFLKPSLKTYSIILITYFFFGRVGRLIVKKRNI